MMNPGFRKLLFVCAVMAVFAVGVVVGQNKFNQPKSVIHVVLVKWKADSTAEQQKKAIEGIKGMAAAIPGIAVRDVPYRTFPLAGRTGTTVLDRSTAYPIFGSRAGWCATDPISGPRCC